MASDYTVSIGPDVFGFSQEDETVYVWQDATRVPLCGNAECREPLVTPSRRWPDRRLDVEVDPWSTRVVCWQCGWTSENCERAK